MIRKVSEGLTYTSSAHRNFGLESESTGSLRWLDEISSRKECLSSFNFSTGLSNCA